MLFRSICFGKWFKNFCISFDQTKEIFLKLIAFCFQFPHFIFNICIFFLAYCQAAYHVTKCSSDCSNQRRSSAAARVHLAAFGWGEKTMAQPAFIAMRAL